MDLDFKNWNELIVNKIMAFFNIDDSDRDFEVLLFT